MSVSRRAFTRGLGSIPLLRGAVSTPQTHPSHNAPDQSSSTDVTVPQPRLFDEHEIETIAILAEMIIPKTDTPGAREAHVAEYIDLILSDSPELIRTAFCEGLWWTDGYCQRSAGAPFKDLSGPDRLRVISELHDSSDEENHTGRVFIRSMKTWTAKIYYSTESGRQELNKGGRVPRTYAGHCES